MRWLLDEMLPPTTAPLLNQRGHDAVSVLDVDLAGSPDAEILEHAVSEERVVVTENVADDSVILTQRLGNDQPCVPVLFVQEPDFPQGGAPPTHLAGRLDAWAVANPEPYVGAHWP